MSGYGPDVKVRMVEDFCGVGMCCLMVMVRFCMTVAAMSEHILRMFLQMVYNLFATCLQILAILPLCCVFALTSGLRGFICSLSGTTGIWSSIGFFFMIYLVYKLLVAMDEDNIKRVIKSMRDLCYTKDFESDTTLDSVAGTE